MKGSCFFPNDRISIVPPASENEALYTTWRCRKTTCGSFTFGSIVMSSRVMLVESCGGGRVASGICAAGGGAARHPKERCPRRIALDLKPSFLLVDARAAGDAMFPPE